MTPLVSVLEREIRGPASWLSFSRPCLCDLNTANSVLDTWLQYVDGVDSNFQKNTQARLCECQDSVFFQGSADVWTQPSHEGHQDAISTVPPSLHALGDGSHALSTLRLTSTQPPWRLGVFMSILTNTAPTVSGHRLMFASGMVT